MDREADRSCGLEKATPPRGATPSGVINPLACSLLKEIRLTSKKRLS